jgi:hypothetical protein
VRWTTRFKQRRHKRPRDPLPERARKAMEELVRLARADMPLIDDREESGT